MAENDDQWLWFDDEESEQSLQVDTGSTDGKTASTSAEVVRAIELHLAGKTEEALKELKRGIDIGKSLPEIYLAYGQICFELKKYDDAAAMFGNLVVLERKHKTGFYNQGVCLEKCGKYSDAAEAFRTALDIDPDRKQARLGLGICLVKLGEAEKALDQFNAYLRLDADQETAQFGRGVALQMLGRVNDAMDTYRKLAAKKPNSAAVLSNLISVSLARNDNNSAKDFSEKLIRLQPQSRAALQG